MTKDEALKLALETLENSRVFVMSREMIKQPEGADWYDTRITAIKEALAPPEQEPVARVIDNGTPEGATEWIPFANRVEPLKTGDLLYATPPQPVQPERGPVAWEQFHEHLVERNFCPRCGKRTADLTTIHTCTPPQGNI